ncbi:MAG: ribosome maturation factor [Thermodesulfobacteriota bacterium]|nr:ribosome maturation factor [Thermodesulfobacteriota bacterium]
MLQETVVEQMMLIAEPILEDMGLELVDLEYQQHGVEWLLRFFIDRSDGINLDLCAAFSRELSAILDVEEVLTVPYRLEVSSPGMDRIIKKDADFERFKGLIVRAKTLVALDPDGRGYRRKTFVGELVGLEQGKVIIYQQDQPESRVELSRDDLEKVNIEPQF